MRIILAASVAISLLSGCLIRTHNHRPASSARRTDCGPAYHWEDGRCVHNGRGRGPVRDHRR